MLLLNDDPDPSKGNKLRTYRKFKSNFGKETYVDIIRNKNMRKSLARLRTSAHKLHIETGRYHKNRKKVEQRICNICNSGDVEDEEHFLMTCATFSTEREAGRCFMFLNTK